MKTKRQRIVEALIHEGYKEQEYGSHRYRAFTIDTDSRYIFVGKSGGMRRGTCISKSFSINGNLFLDRYRVKLMDTAGTMTMTVNDCVNRELADQALRQGIKDTLASGNKNIGVQRRED